MEDIKISNNITTDEVPKDVFESNVTLEENNTESIKEQVVIDKKSEHEHKHVDTSHIKKAKQKRVKNIVLSLIVISFFFFITTIYSQYKVYQLSKIENAKADLLKGEIPNNPQQIIEAVSRHILLPKSTPQVAAVQDANKLVTSQPFFKDTLNGDVVLVYENTIVIYRPSKDIIVAVGDIGSGIAK